jgi:hypothetical protein
MVSHLLADVSIRYLRHSVVLWHVAARGNCRRFSWKSNCPIVPGTDYSAPRVPFRPVPFMLLQIMKILRSPNTKIKAVNFTRDVKTSLATEAHPL